MMSRSNSPQVFGLVSISAATSGPSLASSAARSTRPRGSAGIRSTVIAAGRRRRRIGAVRRFRHQHPPPRRRRGLRARRGSSCMPHSSPCAPAAGESATAGMPVRVFSQCARVSISSSAPWARSTAAAADGCRRSPGSRASFSLSARIVLHRARAERVEPAVDRVVLLRQPGEVAHDLRLAETRKADRAVALEPAETRRETAAVPAGRRRHRPGASCSKISGLLDLKPAVAAESRL